MTGIFTNISTDTLSGLEALSEIFTWHQGEFQFNPDVTPIEKNIGFSVQHAIMEAAVLHDQRINKRMNYITAHQTYLTKGVLIWHYPSVIQQLY